MALKFCSIYICLLGFLSLKLFICPSDVKRPKSFRSFTPWNPHLGFTMNTLQSLPWNLYLHFKIFKNSILVQKTDISRTAWINPWYIYACSSVYIYACLYVWVGTYFCLYKSCYYLSWFGIAIWLVSYHSLLKSWIWIQPLVMSYFNCQQLQVVCIYLHEAVVHRILWMTASAVFPHCKINPLFCVSQYISIVVKFSCAHHDSKS